MDIEFVENKLSAKDFHRLIISAGWNELPENQIEAGIKHSLFTVAAIHNNQVIGIRRAVGDGFTACYIQDVVVLREFQGKGIGKAIMERHVNFIKDSALPGTYVATGLFAAKGMEGFYHQFGFISRPNDNRGAGMTMRLKSDSDATYYPGR